MKLWDREPESYRADESSPYGLMALPTEMAQLERAGA